MDLSAAFNSDYKAHKENDYVLRVSYGNTYYFYDFMARMLLIKDYEGSTKMATMPFSQLDRDALITMRDELARQGGHPPELPAEAPAQAAPKKLNL